jgi:predicted aldo/keto reductase-like oxidoreductase
MRLPLTDPYDPTAIDENKAQEMIYYAIDNGVNFFDTAWPYHRETSEGFLGKILSSGYRDRVYVSTKMPVWRIEKKEDAQKYFDEQRKRLCTDHIDMYHLHALGRESWKTVKQHDVLSSLDKLKNTGKILYAGFSFHDELPLFKEIIDAYPWAFCLIHLNYVDDDYQAGLEGLKYAHEKGIAVLIMEPLRGGKLANNVPGQILSIIKGAGRDQTPAQFALRWLFNQPEVSCVLSGMTTLEQVRANIEFSSRDHIDTIRKDEIKQYAAASEFYQKRTKVNCTQCGYCMPCTQKIPIQFILELYNDAYMYDAFEESRRAYSVFIDPQARAHNCIECRECEEKCPQKIPIAETLKHAHAVLTSNGDQES